METRSALIITALLLALPGVMAAGVALQGPADAITVEPEGLTFSFAVSSDGVVVDACSLLIDGEAKKTFTFDRALSSYSVRMPLDLTDGSYAWMVECATAGGTLASSERRITIATPEGSEVEIIPTGDRGVFIHEFTYTGKSLSIPDVLPGDFLSIKSSTSKYEFYVRNRQERDGVSTVMISRKGVNYYLPLGEPVEIAVPGLTITLQFKAAKLGNKVDLAVIGTDVQVEPEVPVEEAPAEETPDAPETPAEETPAEPEAPVEETPAEETPLVDVPVVEEEPAPEGPPQSILQRLLSWLAGIFGA